MRSRADSASIGKTGRPSAGTSSRLGRRRDWLAAQDRLEGPPMTEPTMDAELAQWLASTPVEADDEATIEESRAVAGGAHLLARERMNPALSPESETDQEIESPQGRLPIRVLRPAGDHARPTVGYSHGGGWISGTIDPPLGHARRICTQA